MRTSVCRFPVCPPTYWGLEKSSLEGADLPPEGGRALARALARPCGARGAHVRSSGGDGARCSDGWGEGVWRMSLSMAEALSQTRSGVAGVCSPHRTA